MYKDALAGRGTDTTKRGSAMDDGRTRVDGRSDHDAVRLGNGRGVPCRVRPYIRGRVMRYKVFLRKSEEGYSVSCPGLPGCWSQGASESEALENIRSAIREYLDVVEEMLRDAPEIEVRELDIAV